MINEDIDLYQDLLFSGVGGDPNRGKQRVNVGLKFVRYLHFHISPAGLATKCAPRAKFLFLNVGAGGKPQKINC